MSGDRASVALAEVLEVSLPLLRPFVTGFGITDTRRTVLVHLRDAEGNEGWGEGPALDHPYYLPDTTTSTFAAAAEFALPLALEAGGPEPATVARAMERIKGNTFARAGVEEAFWSLQAAAEGTTLRALIAETATGWR